MKPITRRNVSVLIDVYMVILVSILPIWIICHWIIKKDCEWNGDRFRKWAEKIGPSTYKVIDRLLSHYKAEQQAYNGCRSILKLADSYSSKQLEEACHMALQHLAVPRYKNIKLIIAHNQDIRKTEEQVIDDSYAIIRGSSYYGGSSDE